MVPEHLIRIGKVNVFPDDARTPIEPIITLWEQINDFFSNYKIAARAYDISKVAEYIVDVDASQVIKDLRLLHEYNTTSGDREDLFYKLYSHLKCGTTLVFRLRPVNEPATNCRHTPRRLVDLLLQEIFIAANLCLPASCKLYKITDLDREDSPPPSMHCFYFEDCARFGRDEGWPKYRQIPFRDAWQWLIDCGIHDLDIAATPVQRALFSLLEMARYEDFNIAEVLLISQALDGLLVKKDEQKQKNLGQRIAKIIGTPSKQQNWMKEFYNLRSTIAHGSYPILREHTPHEESPEVAQYHKQYFVPLVRAIAALLAILQDMVLSRITEYRFAQHETILRIPLTEQQNV
ncbi:hypothetical protein [Aeromonas sp. 603359]|uniref:hypothetical protein n=1 Tax=unclassified Aeromonas TaxID=257493 RepID=UPI003B9E0C37